MPEAYETTKRCYMGGKADSTPSRFRSMEVFLKKPIPLSTDEPAKTTLSGVTLLYSGTPSRVPVIGDGTVRVVKGIKSTVPLSATWRLWVTSKLALAVSGRKSYIWPVERALSAWGAARRTGCLAMKEIDASIADERPR